jgi:hypothetical protein
VLFLVKMNYKKILKYALLVLFLLTQVYVFFFRDYEVRDDTPYNSEFPLPLDEKNRDISQGFRTPGPLARIDIMLANYKIKPKDGALRLCVFNGKNLLFFKNYPANIAEDNRFYSFTIDTGKKPRIQAGDYLLTLSYFPRSKNEKLAAWTSSKTLYPYGAFFVNRKKQESSLTFRVFFHSTIWKERNRWLNPPHGFKMQPYALSVGFLLLLFMVNFLFYYFINKLLDESHN